MRGRPQAGRGGGRVPAAGTAGARLAGGPPGPGGGSVVVGILSRRRSLYTTRRLVESALKLGHETRVLNPLHCFLVLSQRAPEIYYRGLEARVSDLDVVLPRIGASITEHGLAVVNQFDMMGVPLVNNSQPIARSRDKLRSLQLLARAGIDIPKTVMVSDPSQIHRALEIVGGPPAILKVVKGTQGIGVILAETEQAALTVLETFWNLGMNILVQEFIEESEGRDIRALVVGDRVVTAMRRQASVGEFRSNVHRGGTGTVVDLPESYRRVALEAMRVMELQLGGVDMLESETGPKVVEINSSPGFEGLERWTGVDIASAIIEYALSFARSQKRKRKGGA
ncbi:MAG: 30S ribosomal protein S6--L-glutamate ligase [Acidobacteria bacterium]|nr:MAG: 30S ribosomal protein S6--L-glutamate ligase [Acidobacteriota bacterium]